MTRALVFLALLGCGTRSVQLPESGGLVASPDGGIAQRAGALIACGVAHTCVATDGRVRCWGDNEHGQLGDGTTQNRADPVAVAGLDGVIALVAGDDATCALTSAGHVLCWGGDDSGPPGEGIIIDHATPEPVVGIEGAVALSEGALQTFCAITAGGAVSCWGNNAYGQLGDATTGSRPLPFDTGVRGAVAVSTGALHGCALLADGSMRCWGQELDGELGDGVNVDFVPLCCGPPFPPTEVVQLPGAVRQMSVGWGQTLALVGDRILWWGYTGTSPSGVSSVPIDISKKEGAATLALVGNNSHSCFLTPANGVRCFGSNGYGELGDGNLDPGDGSDATPHDVVGLSTGVLALGVGATHNCALTADGLSCWGRDQFGQLGDDNTVDSPVPVKVVGF